MERSLFIVPTPIGNLGDMTLRAIETLKAVDVIAAEDTRHSKRLMQHFAIDTAVVAYHEHATEAVTERLIADLQSGQSVALISDAGTPLVSDPGYRLVRAAQDAGVAVVPLPGACAAITALSASGLATDRFFFEGFLPAKSAARSARLMALKATPATLVFYEAPHRIAATLTDCVTVFGAEREAVLGRELTKSFETIRRLPLVELLRWVDDDANQQRGEIVLLIAAEQGGQPTLDAGVEKLLRRLAQELPPRRAAAVAADVSGLKARELYQWLLEDK